MAELAAKLNVSKCLVSLALSNKYGVSEEMRNKIILTAIENGYDFSKCKKNAKLTKKTVAITIYSMELLSNSFWSEVFMGLERELIGNGYSINIMIIGEETDYGHIALQARELNCRGIVMIGNIVSDASVNYLKQLKIPIVLIDSYSYNNTDVDCVMASNYLGGYNAAKYIAARGHKNICFVGDISYAFSFKQRCAGVKDFFSEMDNDAIKVTYLTKKFDDPILKNYNHEQLTSYIRQHQTEYMAFICASDPIAYVIYDLCRELGLSIGKQVSVLGFDNRETPERIVPRLSSVNIPKSELGRRAAMLLKEKIEQPDKLPQIVHLPTTIEEKESVADLNQI